MSDRPILFSAPMVRALLAGTKTQTRRLLKGAWQSALEGHDEVLTWFAPPDVPWLGLPNRWAASGIYARRHGPSGYNRHLGLTPCRPGDRLWVREAWRCEARYDNRAPTRLPRSAPIYYASDPDPRDSEPGCAGRLRASMHLPRWASRLTLTVTDVRVQHLQDISEEDARAEGITPLPSGRFHCGHDEEGEVTSKSAITAYGWLWNRINGADAWAANPWVVAYSFTAARRNIDA